MFFYNKPTFGKSNKHFTGNVNLITSSQMLLLFMLCFLVVFNQTYTLLSLQTILPEDIPFSQLIPIQNTISK